MSGKSVMVPVSVSGLGGGEGGHQLVEVQADGQPRPPGADLPVDYTDQTWERCLTNVGNGENNTLRLPISLSKSFEFKKPGF